MKATLTITSKGQTTLPVGMRRLLGVNPGGGKLKIDFDVDKGQAIISKVTSIEDLSSQLSSYIKPGMKPILNADKYYQQQRKLRP